MWPWWSYSSLADAASKLPKEALVAIAAYFIITDVHKRNTQVKIEEIKATTRNAELEVEALKLKLKLQEADPDIKSM